MTSSTDEKDKNCVLKLVTKSGKFKGCAMCLWIVTRISKILEMPVLIILKRSKGKFYYIYSGKYLKMIYVSLALKI